MKRILLILSFAVLCLQITSCASIAKKWKSLIGGGSSETEAKVDENGKPIQPTSFNNNPNYGEFKERQYKKITKENFSEDQRIEENAGSLWKKEGQGSFLFSQNNIRVIGDIVNVEVEGKVAENLNVKVGLIKKAQSRFDVPAPRQYSKMSRVPNPESEQERSAAAVPSPESAPKPEPENVATKDEKTKEDQEAMKFDAVPCRITEKNADGSYRVKGLQMVFIGKKEFKLLVTGNIRPDDISSDTISSSRIIDSKFDLIAKDGSR